MLRPAGLNDVEVGVFRQLLEAISERRLAPGVKLTEDELSEIFSVSRERIRRVLLVLSQHGIIVLEPHRGASVACPTSAERRDAFEARQVLEQQVVARLAFLPDARRAAIALELRDHLARERKAIETDDRHLQIRLSGDFHLKLAAYAGNVEILRILQELQAKLSLALAAHAYAHKLDCSIVEHEALVDAIESGDAGKAAALLGNHLGHLQDDMEDSIGNVSPLKRAFAGV